MSIPENAIEAAAKVIAGGDCWTKWRGTVAGCPYDTCTCRVNARAALEAALATGALVPAAEVEAMRDDCAAAAEMVASKFIAHDLRDRAIGAREAAHRISELLARPASTPPAGPTEPKE